MIYKGKRLEPATKQLAGPWDYTWWNGKGTYPIEAGYVFETKEQFGNQIYADYPNGIDVKVFGEPLFLGDGAVIGGPGFGWYGSPPHRFPHIGHIILGDRVEIGANSTIDRGSVSETVIGNDVKIDNGVHVGHNAVIGDRSILTAHCVIGGSAVIGYDVWVGLGAQIKNQVTVGNDAVVGMGAIVVKDVEPGTTVVGNPARPM